MEVKKIERDKASTMKLKYPLMYNAEETYSNDGKMSLLPVALCSIFSINSWDKGFIIRI